MKYSREEVVQRLRSQIADGYAIVCAGVGTGLVARCAEAEGVSLLVVYNSGFFRQHGLPSSVGNLPLANANDLMLHLGTHHILPIVKRTPVVAGVYACDPTKDMNVFLRTVSEAGFSGVINFPTVGRLDGNFRADLESFGFGYDREVEMIALARKIDLFTMAYAFTPDEARRMVRAGVDVLVAHVGVTGGGDVGSRRTMDLRTAAERTREICAAARAERGDIICLSHGGPIIGPEDAEYINREAGTVGFVGASSIERIPVEKAIREACRSFRKIRIL